jgi:ACS family allantoate permease-like MFS transporter
VQSNLETCVAHADFLEQSICLCDLGFIYFYCRLQNKKKAKVRAQPGYVKLENQEFLDLTDRENPEFVYTL